MPNPDELQHFIEKAFKITQKPIKEIASFIYTLNSKDEGSTLRYSGNKDNICKKAAIIIGGNILSRGLTIENLSVTFMQGPKLMLSRTPTFRCVDGLDIKDHILTSYPLTSKSTQLFFLKILQYVIINLECSS